MAYALTDDERRAAADAGIAVFADRLILNACAPVDEATLETVAAHCAGPLPGPLIALWRTAFGGSLDYDLRCEFEGFSAPVSMTELFYPGSDGYRDLFGWIENEQECAQEVAEDSGEAWSGLLEMLPFGGFEYLDRIYVEVADGADHGAVWAWKRALPPAWRQNDDDVAARVAGDVRGLFGRLVLEHDPWEAGSGGSAGEQMRTAIEELPAGVGAASRAADRLRDMVRASVLDWRAAVDDGTIARQRDLRRLALERAARADDVSLLAQLAELGCHLDEEIIFGATPVDIALSAGALRVARWLIGHGVSVTSTLRFGAHAVDVELARELLARGATVDEYAVLSAADGGQLEVAVLLGSAPSMAGAGRQDLVALVRRRLARAEGPDAQRLRALADGLTG